jgi:cobaltochelatase CobT
MQSLEQSLRARTRCRNRRFLDRGRLDRRRLAHVAMSTSRAVFRRQETGEALDVAVEIVVDESASMRAIQHGTSQIDMVRRVVMVVCEALFRLNIPFELTGTTTTNLAFFKEISLESGFSRTNPIEYRHYKCFGQRWGERASSLMQMGAFRHNIDGEAIEWASRRLQGRSEPRKVILSLSDGSPMAGHGPESDVQMAQNLIRSCERARADGVEVYGFGVGTTGPARFYGADNFVHLDVESGSAKMGVEFAQALASILIQGKMRQAV